MKLVSIWPVQLVRPWRCVRVQPPEVMRGAL